MAIPTPEPGLIISYAYVWDHEAQSGQGCRIGAGGKGFTRQNFYPN
jgi:hypothetical protein